jgi:hypothetical protein
MKSVLLHILLFGLAFSIKAQDKIESSFEYNDGKIIIHYELKADNDKEYEVNATLKRKSDASFSYVPASLSGDIGKGKFAGGIRTIEWVLNASEQNVLTGDDYFFEVKAVPVSKGIPWYYYVGTAALGGGVAAVLVLKKSSDTQTATSFPQPPSRP